MSTVSHSVTFVPVALPHTGRWARPATPLVVLALSWLLALSTQACGVDKPAGGTDAGPLPDGGAQAPRNAASATGLAVLSSDYMDTSVALYDPATGKLRDDCLHSGSTSAQMPQALSGDATLPSQTLQTGELAVIDRKNATITLVDPEACTPRLQFSVSTGGFKSNPHDVISVSADKLYVTRYEKNAGATADANDFDDGDDILVVNAKTGAITKSIVLSDQVPAGLGPDVQARPDRGVFAEGKVYVTLGLVSGDFSTTGPGRIVVIDPATDTVVGAIDLNIAKGCSALDYHAATKKLYVSCGGAFSDGAKQAQRSALVEIDVSLDVPLPTRTIPADLVGGQPLNFSYAAVLGDFAFVGTLGSFPDTTSGSPGSSDAFFGVALNGSTASKIQDGGAYNLGRVAVDASRKRVFLPDGDFTKPRVHVFDASAMPIGEMGTFESNPAGHLPPREVVWY